MKSTIHFDRNILTDFNKASRLEWVETNGLGGYASSSIIGANTRRYHGLLVSSGQGLARHVLLSKFEEFLIIRGMRYDLSCNQYKETIHPGGHLLLSSFDRYPFPTFTYDFENIHLKKEIFMSYGEETTVIIYTLLTPGVAKLHIRPLIAYRDYHSLTRENPVLDTTTIENQGKVSIHPYPGMPALTFYMGDGTFVGPPYWFRDFYYPHEKERGLESIEDLFSLGEFVLHLTPSHPAALIVTSGERTPGSAVRLRKQEIDRRENLLTPLPVRNVVTESLALSADQFIIREKTGRTTIIAGYPWFTDWGRDTMISLHGLTLCTGRHSEAREILTSYARMVKDGLIPNRIVEGTGGSEYNTVDASLFFIDAIDRYLRVTHDYSLLELLFPTLEEIIQAFRNGTRYGIGMDRSDHLLAAGEEGSQLTWMDAKIGNWVVTPRIGKPVEVNALWHHALRRMAVWSEFFQIQRDYSLIAKHVHESFNRRFWYEKGGYLYDVIDTVYGPDTSIRPNQILAISLDTPLLDHERAVRVFNLVTKELLTPMGLRSLHQTHPSYRKQYHGSPWERDSAYHQGTVWAWWIGPYIDACLKFTSDKAEIQILTPLLDQLKAYGVGTISEIFDGDSPHEPKGCPAQAWSVAEVLRSYLTLREHIKGK